MLDESAIDQLLRQRPNTIHAPAHTPEYGTSSRWDHCGDNGPKVYETQVDRDRRRYWDQLLNEEPIH